MENGGKETKHPWWQEPAKAGSVRSEYISEKFFVKEWKAEKQRILDQKKKENEKTMSKEEIIMANKKKVLENKLVNRRKRIGIMSE